MTSLSGRSSCARQVALAALLLLVIAPEARAQWPPADSADVASIDGIMHAFYEVISGPAGVPRQWARDSSLYIPGVRFVALSMRSDSVRANVMSHGDFAASSDAYFVREGFFERELARAVRRFGNTAQVMSSYEMRNRPDGPVIGRGVNSLNLYFDGVRWWIANAVWDDERPDNPLPGELDGD